LKVSNNNVKSDHVKVSLTIIESDAFKKYLALSRDSYPMGLGRLVALCLQVLHLDRYYFSRFEMDRLVQWPADRNLGFGEVLEAIGWAEQRPNSRTLLELTLPGDILPRRPLKRRAAFRAVRLRGDDGQFVSRSEVENLVYRDRPVILLDVDGRRAVDLNSFSTPEKKSNYKRRKKNE
jgi:hypothetical protein